MFAEKDVQKAKPTEACGRRIAQGGLIAMLAQTKRWGWDSQGKGWNRNLLFPWGAPLVPFRRCGKERKKEIEFTQNIRLTQIML